MRPSIRKLLAGYLSPGSMGLWRALAEVFPTARHQRCWVHKARKSRTPCRSPPSPGRRIRCRRSATPRTATTPRRRSRCSRRPTGRSSLGPSRRAVTTPGNCRRSTTSALSTGSTCGDKSHRVQLRHGQTPHQGHPRRWQFRRRPGDGLQAGRVRPNAGGRSLGAHLPASRTACWSSARMPPLPDHTSRTTSTGS